MGSAWSGHGPYPTGGSDPALGPIRGGKRGSLAQQREKGASRSLTGESHDPAGGISEEGMAQPFPGSVGDGKGHGPAPAWPCREEGGVAWPYRERGRDLAPAWPSRG